MSRLKVNINSTTLNTRSQCLLDFICIAATARRSNLSVKIARRLVAPKIESNDYNSFGLNETITGNNINEPIDRIDVSTNTTFSVSTIVSSTKTVECESNSVAEKRHTSTNTVSNDFNSFGMNGWSHHMQQHQ